MRDLLFFIRGGRRNGAVCQALDPGKEVRSNMGRIWQIGHNDEGCANTQPFESPFSFPENGPIRKVMLF